MQDKGGCGRVVRFVLREMAFAKKKDRLAAAFPKSGQVQLNQSARALRQAGAGPEGKVRLLLPSARSDLQRHIGDFKGKKFFVGLFKCLS